MPRIPSECENNFCNDKPELRVTFTDPYEEIYYCSWHAGIKAADPKVTDINPI